MPRQAHVRLLTFFLALLIGIACVAAITGRLTFLGASIALAPAGITSVLVPAAVLAARLQSVFDALRQVPTTTELDIDNSWVPADRIEAGMWVCRKSDFEDATRKHRRQHGRSAREPEATYKLLLAFTTYSGSQMKVAFSGGSTEFWNPQAYVSVLDGPVAYDRQASAGSARALNMALLLLANQPNQSLECGQLVSKLPSHYASPEEVCLALRAAEKWSLVEVQGDQQQTYRLTATGQEWVEATPEGYQKNVQRRVLRSGGSVTNNFFGPSNYVQGSNYGTMSANQIAATSPDQLLDAMRQVLDLQSIPWSRPELAEVRGSMVRAVAKGDPARAKTAVRKLRSIVEQLALGVSGNAAYQLLTAFFN